MSTCDMTQPPKMSPCWFASAGIGTTRSVGARSGSVTVMVRRAAACGPARLCGPALHFVAQLAPQDLADVGLRQVLAEFDFARTLVAGQMLAAMPQDVLDRQRLVLLHHEQLHCLAGLGVRNADGGA